MSGNVMELSIGKKRVILSHEEDGGYAVYVSIDDDAYILAATSSRDIALYAFHQAYHREQEDWLAMKSAEVFL